MTKASKKGKTKTPNDALREFSFDEYVREFLPESMWRQEEDDEQFSARLTRETIHILKNGKSPAK